jgi:GNAT superfamily N-acetyltransferase
MTQPRFERCDPEEAPASELLAEMGVELVQAYGAPNRLDQPALEPDELRPPAGAYLVGYEGEQVVAGGGVRHLTEGVGEIKRMYVRPPARSRGVAGVLLAALEAEAVDLGYRAVRLDTGPKQVHALQLYRSSGFVEVAPYNDNPFACYWAEKALVQPGARSGRGEQCSAKTGLPRGPSHGGLKG